MSNSTKGEFTLPFYISTTVLSLYKKIDEWNEHLAIKCIDAEKNTEINKSQALSTKLFEAITNHSSVNRRSWETWNAHISLPDHNLGSISNTSSASKPHSTSGKKSESRDRGFSKHKRWIDDEHNKGSITSRNEKGDGNFQENESEKKRYKSSSEERLPRRFGAHIRE